MPQVKLVHDPAHLLLTTTCAVGPLWTHLQVKKLLRLWDSKWLGWQPERVRMRMHPWVSNSYLLHPDRWGKDSRRKTEQKEGLSRVVVQRVWSYTRQVSSRGLLYSIAPIVNNKVQYPPLFVENMFWDTQWIPDIANSTEPYIYIMFSPIHLYVLQSLACKLGRVRNKQK